MKRDAAGFSGRSDLGFECDQLNRICICHGDASQTGTMFVVKMGDQLSREEHSKGTRKLDLATLQTAGAERTGYQPGFGHAVKFAPHAGGKPFRVEIAAFAGAQPAKGELTSASR